MDYEIVKLGEEIPENTMRQLVEIHRVCFPDDAKNDNDREKIFKCWNNPPIMDYWTANDESKVAGYVRWFEHGGIRPKAVIELEQIAIHPDYQGKDIGTNLIDASLGELAKELKSENREIKLVYVSTGDNNFAQRLYNKTLGAKVVAKIPSFYEDSNMNVNEVIMLSRKDEINETRKGRDLETI